MAHSARYFWLLAGATALAACAAGRAPTLAPAPAARPPALAELSGALVESAPVDDDGPRLFPPLSGPATAFAGEELDGSRRLIAYGLRVLSRPSGAVELAAQYLPAARAVQTLELPARLGAGFVFYVVTSNATLFFRAATFTGDLKPFARLDFEVDQVIAGFDRLYVVSHRPERLLALDAESGAAIGGGSLPPSPAYDKLAFADAWFGAVNVPLRGTLVSFDAGTSWRPLAFAATELEARDGMLRLTGTDGVFDLDSSGRLTPHESQAPAAPRENAVARALRAGNAPPENPLKALDVVGRDALKLAVLRGFRDEAGALIVANAGMLLRVRASDGQLQASELHAYPGGGECNALRLGQGFGFACADGPDQTALYRFVPPLAMQRVRSFSGARYLASSGNGSLVIRGGCKAGAAQPGAYCIARSPDDFREIRVSGDLGAERVAALSDGRIAVIVPPRLGAPGFLSLLGVRGHEQRIALKLPAPQPASSLLEKGLWLDGFVEQAGGLSGWVVGGEPFAGVRIALDGAVTMSRAESSIDRVLLSGSHALVIARSGRARESSDGGFAWTVEMPTEFDTGRELSGDARLQGCSELGCAFAGFVRVGYRARSAAPRLLFAAIPEATPLASPGGARWLLHCEATGETSDPALPAPARVRRAASKEDATSAPWSPFLELAPPAITPGELGFDVNSNDGDAAQFHAYAWGQRAADWSRVGHLQLRVLDRFRVQRAPFSSALSRSPWADASAASEAFGYDGTGNPVSWRAVLEPGGRSAAVLVSSHGVLDLLLFEEGKTVTRIPNAGHLGFNFGMLSSLVRLSDAWYAAAFNENHALVVSKISRNGVERWAEYPDLGRDLAFASLVRGVRGDELGLWVTGHGWHVFPIDAKSHALHNPLSLSFADLAHVAPACAPDADGFLLSGALSLEPNLRFSAPNSELSARHVEAQFVWSARGLCTRALAADSEAQVKRTTPSAAPRAVAGKVAVAIPLTLSERRADGRRWGYLCSP